MGIYILYNSHVMGIYIWVCIYTIEHTHEIGIYTLQNSYGLGVYIHCTTYTHIGVYIHGRTIRAIGNGNNDIPFAAW